MSRSVAIAAMPRYTYLLDESQVIITVGAYSNLMLEIFFFPSDEITCFLNLGGGGLCTLICHISPPFYPSFLLVCAAFCVFKGLGWVCRESTDVCVCVCMLILYRHSVCGGGALQHTCQILFFSVSGLHSSLVWRWLFSTVTMETRAAWSAFLCVCVCVFAAPEFTLCLFKRDVLLSHWDTTEGL